MLKPTRPGCSRDDCSPTRCGADLPDVGLGALDHRSCLQWIRTAGATVHVPGAQSPRTELNSPAACAPGTGYIDWDCALCASFLAVLLLHIAAVRAGIYGQAAAAANRRLRAARLLKDSGAWR